MNKKKFTQHIKLLFIFLFLILSYSTHSHSVNIVRNEVEDPRLTGEEFEGSAPNVSIILDLSRSMTNTPVQGQVGNWDGLNTFNLCGNNRNPDDNDDQAIIDNRVAVNFCMENLSGLNTCAKNICTNSIFDNSPGGTTRDINSPNACTTRKQLAAQQDCIINMLPGVNNINDDLPIAFKSGQNSISCLYDRICGNEDNICSETLNDCIEIPDRNHAAYAMEVAAGFTQCSNNAPINNSRNECISSDANCSNMDINECSPACQTFMDTSAFRACMRQDQSIFPQFTDTNCNGESCSGRPRDGSSRIDGALNVIFNFLDADNSFDDIEQHSCNLDGELVSCDEFINAPYHDPSDFVRGIDTLPSSTSETLFDAFSQDDADILDFRFLPMNYVGRNFESDIDVEACINSSGTISYDEDFFRSGHKLDPNDPGEDGLGFQGGNKESIDRMWRFYNDREGSGGTPLALILGFDDESGAGGIIESDVLAAYRQDMDTDPGVACRPQFNIVITDGSDTCSGDCSVLSGNANTPQQCTGRLSSNANRRSTIQAVSNLRTHFSRNPVTADDPDNPGTQIQVNKEVITFVIGLGINDQLLRRNLNAMALAGGSHTKGIIKHIDPATGEEFGAVSVEPLEDCIDLNLDIDHQNNTEKSAICGSIGDGLDVFRNIGKAENLINSPASSVLQNCGNTVNVPDVNGICRFQNEDVFGNIYFNEGRHQPPGGNPVDIDLEGFAFFVNSPEELSRALEDIFNTIDDFTTTGVAPSAPQTAGNVTLRDRVFLALTNPLAGERIWQGRLGLYSFVNDPNTPGTSLIVRKPSGSEDYTSTAIDLEDFSIFTNGRLNDNARQYHWEAGSLLATRDPVTRNIFFTEPGFNTAQSGSISYLGNLMPVLYDANGNSPTNITPADLGIQDEDITVLDTFPPAECDVDTSFDCSSDCEEVNPGNIDEEDASECRDCIKDCFRDRIISFISGNTSILPGDDNVDPLGHICSDGSDGFDPTTVDPDICSVRMGDIFHSSPRTVASPSVLFFDTGFQFFTRAFQERSAVVYAGANDGGLHAFHAGELVDTSQGAQRNPFNGNDEALPFFDEGTGSEMFFYIPPTFFPDATASITPETPFGNLTPPAKDYRFGDLKTYVLGDPEHRSFFDGTVSIADVYIDGFDNGISTNFCELNENDPGVSAEVDGLISSCGKEWHTVLISGFRNGGGGLTALDITNANCEENDNDPNNDPNCDISTTFAGSDTSIFSGNSPGYPTHLWSVFDQDFGNTWSNPEIARVRLRGQTSLNGNSTEIFADRWVAFVGGGVDPLPSDNTSYGNAFYAVDITTGQIIYKFHPDRSIPINLDSGISSDQEDLANDMQCELASDPGVFDVNADGYTDLVYIGDTCGRLWRFDVSQPLNAGNSSGTGSISNTGLTISDSETLTRGNETIDASGWRASIAFCANRDPKQCNSGDNPAIPQTNIEPIYFPPTSAIDNIGRRHLIFQSGNRRNPTQIAEFVNEQPVIGTHNGGRLYNFIDTFIPSFLAGNLTASESSDRGMLTAGNITRTISLTQDGNSDVFEIGSGGTDDESGEYIVEYPNNIANENAGIGGEKGVGIPVVINGALVFVTFAPTPFEITSPCRTAFGDTRVFALDFVTGIPALSRIRGAVAANNNINSSSAGLQLSQGISSGTTLTYGSESSVILTISSSGNEDGASFIVWEVPIAVQTQTLFWEEVL